MIYLVQSGVWDILFRVVRRFFGINGDSRLLIPVSVACVFLASYVLSVAWEKISIRIRNV